MRKIMVSPSILSADFAEMGEAVKMLEHSGADLVHCDVMDGIFVPNITFGPKMVADLKKRTTLPLDVHLMITKPERYINNFIKAGADIITIHVEASDKTAETLKKIREKGIKCGAVISPDTSAETLEEFLPLCDLVLIMSVYPGFGGQKFIDNSLCKLNKVRELRNALNPQCLIEVDGGINTENAAAAVEAGADILVAGNAVFGAPSMKEAILKIRGKV